MTQAEELNKLNKDFYSQISDYFDSSRRYYWDGWSNILETKAFKKLRQKSKEIKILDLGCGNGRFYEFLSNQLDQKIIYYGLDSDKNLINLAKKRYASEEVNFWLEDIFISDFIKKLHSVKFELIVFFGVIHHLPYDFGKHFFQKINRLVGQNSLIIFSSWQFINFDSTKKRILKNNDPLLNKILTKYNIKVDLLDQNDYFLDWNRGQRSIRYCRHYDDKEIQQLCEENNLEIIYSYEADGKEGRVNKYFFIKTIF